MASYRAAHCQCVVFDVRAHPRHPVFAAYPVFFLPSCEWAVRTLVDGRISCRVADFRYLYGIAFPTSDVRGIWCNTEVLGRYDSPRGSFEWVELDRLVGNEIRKLCKGVSVPSAISN